LDILARRLCLGTRVVSDQIALLTTQARNAGSDLFGEPGLSDRQKRELAERQIKRLKDALKQLERDERQLALLKQRALDKNFYCHLRELEGAQMDGPHNFVWRLDFPHVLAEKDKATVLDNLSLVNEAGQEIGR